MDASGGMSAAGGKEMEAARRVVRQALQQRYMLAKRMERDGFRRAMGGVLIFVGKSRGLARRRWWCTGV